MGLHLSQRRGEIRTDYEVTDSGLEVKVSRVINSKVYSFYTKLDGTIGDLDRKVGASALIPDINFKDLANIVKDLKS